MWTTGPANKSHILLSGMVLFTGLLSVILSLPANRDVRTPIQAGIDEILDSEPNRNAFWGVYVRSISDSSVVYERNADHLLIPASNQKLVTAATALHFLGGSFRYDTPLLFSGTRNADTLRGDLIVVGSGDPTFGGRDVDSDAPDPFELWATQLYAAGIRKIDGRIIGDDDVFDNELFGDGWDVSLLPTNAFAAPVGGISYRSNTIRMRVEGYQPGKAPRIKAEPDGYFSITNEVATHSRRRGRRIDVIRPLGRESLLLEGAVSRRFRGSLEVPVANPTTFAVSAFKHQLQAAGIEVTAAVYDIDDLSQRPRYRGADTLGVIESQPLSELLLTMNKESNNQYAEQLFRTYGWGGSAGGGERRTRQLLTEAGIDHRGLSTRDGSGLSRKNMISARMLGDLLVFMENHPESETFINSLAVSGERHSTMARRLTRYELRAKTGSLEYVRSLSGYVAGEDGQLYAFSILANNYTTSASSIRRSIDAIVGVLVSSDSASR